MENGVCWWRGCHEWDSHSAHIRWTLCTSKHCATSLQHRRLVNSALSRQHSLQDRQLIIGHHCCLATHRTNLLSWCSCPNDGQETHSGQKVYVCVSICPSVCLCVCVFTPHWKITQNLVKSKHVVTSQQKPKCECEGKPSVLHKLVSEQKCVDRHQASLTSLFLKICSVNHRKSPMTPNPPDSWSNHKKQRWWFQKCIAHFHDLRTDCKHDKNRQDIQTF